jgi:acyl carrier protein
MPNLLVEDVSKTIAEMNIPRELQDRVRETLTRAMASSANKAVMDIRYFSDSLEYLDSIREGADDLSRAHARLFAIIFHSSPRPLGKSDKELRLLHFENDLSLDSLDCVELLMDVEEEFEIDISEHEAEQVATVGQLVDLVVAKLDLTPASRSATMLSHV